MAINKKLIHFKSKENFDAEVANGNILDNSIVFIQDSKEISTHGEVYKTVNWSILEEEKELVINSAGKSNGVYIVTKDYELVDKSTQDNTALGVVLITDNQRILISKADATDGTNSSFYWEKSCTDLSLSNIRNISGAKADFSGKDNTTAIAANSSNSRDMCKVLESYTEGGFNDWYVPAAGQLYEICTNITDINAALTKIGGTAFESYVYWSSSERGINDAWNVTFGNGRVGNQLKDDLFRVRFVRDID